MLVNECESTSFGERSSLGVSLMPLGRWVRFDHEINDDLAHHDPSCGCSQFGTQRVVVLREWRRNGRPSEWHLCRSLGSVDSGPRKLLDRIGHEKRLNHVSRWNLCIRIGDLFHRSVWGFRVRRPAGPGVGREEQLIDG